MKTTLQHSPGLERVRKILDEAEAPLSAREIVALAHVSYNAWNNHYRAHLLANKEIHVAGWCRYQFGWAPEYAAGTGKTPRKPKAPPPKVATAKWKERTGYVDPRYAHRRLARPRDPILSALLGVKPGYQKHKIQPGETA